MSATATLKEFVKEQLADKRFASRSDELKRYREDVEALYKQIEQWIRTADPEGRVFDVSNSSYVIDDEKFYGSFGIPIMSIRLLTGDGDTVSLYHRALLTTRSNTFGLMEMTNGLKKYYVYRRQPQPNSVTEWELVNSDTNQSEPWSQNSFESALQYLVK